MKFLVDEFGVTNTLVSVISPYMESAQQGFLLRARELDKGLLDHGAMVSLGWYRGKRDKWSYRNSGYNTLNITTKPGVCSVTIIIKKG